MRIKIVSDGTSKGTSVVNAETGEPIEMVTRVLWRLDAKEQVAEAVLYLKKVSVEMVGEGRWQTTTPPPPPPPPPPNSRKTTVNAW
jgi:hypothetical protein